MNYLAQAGIFVLSKTFGYPTAPTNATTTTNFSASVPINNNQTTKNTALNFYGPVDVKISNNQTEVHGSENKINQTNKQAGHTSKPELKPASSSQPIQGPCTQSHSRAVRPNQNIKMLENGVVVLDPRLLDLAKAKDLTKFTRSIKKGEQNGIPYFMPLGSKFIRIGTIAHNFANFFIAYVGFPPEKTIEIIKNGFCGMSKEGITFTIDPLYALSLVQECAFFQRKKYKIVLQVKVDATLLQEENTWTNMFYKYLGWQDTKVMHTYKFSYLLPYAVCLYPEH